MGNFMDMSFKSLAVAALAVGGGIAFQPAPAEAQVYYGRPGFYGGYRPAAAFYGPRYGYGWRGGYRPAYYGYRYGGYSPYGYYRRSYNGGAIAAGVIGGLALGAIASAAAQPAYYPAYAPGYYPAYYQAPYPRAYGNCAFERRRVVTRNGNVVVRRVRSCY